MNCIDIGTIQAFLDGELELEYAARVSEHLDACDICAGMLAEAESEEAFVIPALAREFDTLVPTQRLWTKINAHIETERRERPWYTKIAGVALELLAKPSFAIAAAAVLFAAIGTTFIIIEPNSAIEMAGNTHTPAARSAETDLRTVAKADPQQNTLISAEPETELSRPVRVTETRSNAVRASYSSSPAARSAVSPANVVDPAEVNYESTIASLSGSLRGQKDVVMAVQERIAFERDMAVVDNTIQRMRAQVRKNPNDSSARQVLYDSYQDKIDLLNSISQKQELVASLR